MICVLPDETPVAVPFAPIEATVGELEVHVTGGLVTIAPLASRAITEKATFPPTGVLALGGLSVAIPPEQVDS